MSKIKRFIENMPKAELHVHLEGTLEPELKLAGLSEPAPASGLLAETLAEPPGFLGRVESERRVLAAVEPLPETARSGRKANRLRIVAGRSG